MSFSTSSGRTFLDVSAHGVHAWRGLSVHRLGFTVHFRVHAWDVGVVARNFKAMVTLPTFGDAYVGIAWPEQSFVVESLATPYDGAHLFRIDLTDADIERIEEQRQGRDLRFNLLVMCEVSGAGTRAWPSQDHVGYNVSRATWIDLLAAFGLNRRLLIEVDIPPEGAVPPAVGRLLRARTEHNAGNYDGVVRECRIALESIKNALKLEDETRNALQQYNGGERRRMTKRARALLVNELAIHYAHLAHHPDEDGLTVDFGRRDAAFMLALTAAAVSNNLNGGE